MALGIKRIAIVKKTKNLSWQISNCDYENLPRNGLLIKALSVLKI